ncbi:hypothetical protein Tsubulata_030196 [Turnera subulata]|uniref:Uncharacterized protein n=1 Tax=Turnera subulata TaxID=218843 RepID=A0A9Q0JFX6_9ROSI|nr:hypothetical protein Tsubulata_030196 [Turnera subulata]
MLSRKVLIFAPKPSLLRFVSSFSSLAKTPQTPNPIIQDYLLKHFSFNEKQALAVSSRYAHLKSLEKPHSVVRFLKAAGLSDSEIQSTARSVPQILFSSVDKVIKPKVEFFQGLGISGPCLGKLIVLNPLVLVASLENKLVPCVAILRRILINDRNCEDLFKILCRCNQIVCRDPNSLLLPNIAFFESCGIVGSQLAMLLRRHPMLFVKEESFLKSIVSKTLSFGFTVESRMFVHGLVSAGTMSDDKVEEKVQVFKSFGISKEECCQMFVVAPSLMRTSERKLRLAIDFFLNTVKFEREELVRRAVLLIYSLEERVIPRYMVTEVIKSKRLLKKEPKFSSLVLLTDEEFEQKYIFRFKDNVEELLTAYRAHLLTSSSDEGKDLV